MTTASLINKNELNELKTNKQLILELPHVPGINLTIYRDCKILHVLGIPATFYGELFLIEDNADSIFKEHKLTLNLDEMYEYVQELLEAKNKQELHYIRSLKEKGLQLGSEIEFEDGKRAVIVPLSEDCQYLLRALFYIPLKKDGTMSKIKPRILYGNAVYKIITDSN